jgi:probable F420-dependent oxidoreductase
MKFWQGLAFMEVDQMVQVAKICEEVGFDGLLVSDHLLHFEDRVTPYPHTADGTPPFSAETAWPECWSLIGTLGAVTTRLRFLTFVYILPLRHPIEVAKATATAATFCEGRVYLGAGAGWMKEEFDAIGIDFQTRGKRFEECLDVLRKLWTGSVVEHHGRFFDLPRVQMRPVPRQPIPIYLGGASPAALRRAARVGDGWVGAGQTVEHALETVAQLNRLRAEAGRAGEPFETIVPLTGPPRVDELKRLRDAGVGSAVSYPFTVTIGPTSTIEQKRAQLERFAKDVIAKLKD